MQKYIGEGSRMVRELFVMARQHAPSIIFMVSEHPLRLILSSPVDLRLCSSFCCVVFLVSVVG